jgi:hypothetical protein
MKVRLTMSKSVFFAIIAAAFVVALAPVTSEAHGKRWSGIDPRLEINGELLNVRVEWEEGRECDINGPIQIEVLVPARSNVKFLGESVERFDCNGDGMPETSLATNTLIKESIRPRRVIVTAMVESPGERFRTRLELYKNMELATICNGRANSLITCRGPRY